MIIRKAIDLYGTDRDVKCPKGGFRSIRLLLSKDGMGFGMTRTIIPVTGEWQVWHYKNHLEACYCESGTALLMDPKTNDCFQIRAGMMYALDKHDRHLFKAITETVLICVFNPPLKGREIHQEDGSYGI